VMTRRWSLVYYQSTLSPLLGDDGVIGVYGIRRDRRARIHVRARGRDNGRGVCQTD